MFAFSTLSILATLALSAFTSAAPFASTGVVSSVEDLVAVPDVPSLVPRATAGVYEVITTVTETIRPQVAELTFLTAQNATVDNISNIVVGIRTVLGTALVDVQGLMCESTDVILAPIEGTVLITVAELAEVVSELLILVFEALGFVLTIVSADILPSVTYLLASLAEVVGCLLCAVIMLVDNILVGLVGALVPLISSILSIIGSLNITIIVAVLGLSI
ncbi:hypothetical protein BKA93DRAFT_734425 [Sparassis latifolia]|uniref:Uncharacterized protein n=1 Tax=Sparassis crispa TaxID=139825 RepID=A0A401GQI8_9APHY|nr:hypothetical protein SCP_0604670 [Sparassis crispa]GBE84488.1 hypothetical protein SCP_0604670 [Sparassis crispa]